MPVTKQKQKFRSAALQYTHDHFIGHTPKLVEEYEAEVINADIARKSAARESRVRECLSTPEGESTLPWPIRAVT